MVASRTAGFTILETMLFLAITGLLIMGIITGVGVSINTQRYRDSVQSLKSFIQNQYTQLTDVVNDRDNSWTCDASAKTTQGAQNSGTSRGQSDCVILGRYIIINKEAMSVQNVIGTENATTTTNGTDVDLIKANYTLNLATDSTETSTLEWGSRIAWPTEGNGSQSTTTDRSIGILLIRSPTSGTIYTFTVDTPPSSESTTGEDLSAFMVTGTPSKNYGSTTLRGQSQRTICVDSNGLLGAGAMAVVLQANAINSTSVQTQSNDLLQQGNNAEGTTC